MKNIKRYITACVRFILEHLTIIATLVASTYIVIASQIVPFTVETLLLWIVSLLGLLAISSLSERLLTLNKISKNTEILIKRDETDIDTVFKTRKELTPLEYRLETAKSIIITGGSLSRLSDEYFAYFEEKLKDGCDILIIMVKPFSPAADLLCKNVVYETRDTNRYSNKIEESIKRFIKLKEMYPSLIDVRITDNVPPFGILAIDINKPNSWLQIELYTYEIPTRDRLQFFITPQNIELYKFFVQQIKTLTAQSQEYTETP